ncbi:MAG TPA: hypothetical protein ENI11_05980 [Actinobacteria bacterium]|nr:hypothetical protein [Actinomycetota bacterium]
MTVSKGKKALAGILIAIVGLVIAIIKCRSCRERLQKLMMSKMQNKMPNMMPNMMQKMIGKLAKDDQLKMVTHCKTMFSDMEDKLKNEPT